jgi:dihydroorotate dehydrogenase
MRVPLDTLIIGNGAGSCRNLGDVERLCKSEVVNRITFGPVTMEKREGNIPVPPGDVYYFNPLNRASVNSIGLKNDGWGSLRETIRTAVRMAHDAGKELWVQANCFSFEEFVQLPAKLFELGVDGVDINLGCPNIHDGGSQKPIFSYHPELSEQALMAVREGVGVSGSQKLSVKVSPVPDDIILPLGNAIVRSGIIREVVAINTLPNQEMLRPDGTQALAFRSDPDGPINNKGGEGGSDLVREHAVRVLRGLGEVLPPHIRRIGLGGIWTGAHLAEILDTGAAGFMCTTPFLENGVKHFDHLLLTVPESEPA